MNEYSRRGSRKPSVALSCAALAGATLFLCSTEALADEERGTALGFSGGFAFGGEELLFAEFADGSEQRIRAGDGVVLAFHGLHTPFWFGDHAFGLGGRAELGVKVSSITAQNGSVNFWRFPLVGMLHAFTRVSEHVFLSAASGLHYEMGPGLSGSGALEPFSVDAENGLGWVVEAGMYWHGGRAFEVNARYTRLELDFPIASVDASSITLLFKVYFPL